MISGSLLLDAETLSGFGAAPRRTVCVLFHFVASGVQHYVCEFDCFLVAVTTSAATAKIRVAGHSPNIPPAGTDSVGAASREFVSGNLAPPVMGFRILYRKDEPIYVRNETGGEYNCALHLEPLEQSAVVPTP
jgi:hypothetical protein